MRLGKAALLTFLLAVLTPTALADVEVPLVDIDVHLSAADSGFPLMRTPVPEPATFATVTFGSIGVVFRRRRHRRW